MEIKDKENNIIQSFNSEKKKINVNELEINSLDEEFENYKFNKISINDISDIKLKNKDKLSFNIMGNLDSNIENQIEYEISLKDNNNKTINATCNFQKTNNLDNQVISCNSLIDKQSQKLILEEGIYTSKSNNNDKLILNNNKDANIVVTEKKSYIWLIVGISIGVLVILSIVLILIFKFALKKKDGKRPIKQNETSVKVPKITINSKESFT